MKSPLVLLAITATVAFVGADTLRGRVVGVTDGDTVKVLVDRREVKVRVWGIDCPEGGQAFGKAAKKRCSDLVFGKPVDLETKDVDRYGRTVAKVSAGGVDLGAELIRSGLAWWYERYAPNESLYGRLEREARAAKRGLWADAAPVAPWEWRKSKR